MTACNIEIEKLREQKELCKIQKPNKQTTNGSDSIFLSWLFTVVEKSLSAKRQETNLKTLSNLCKKLGSELTNEMNRLTNTESKVG